MHFERILTGFRPKQIAMGLAAMLAVGAVQAAATPANAETLTMTFNQAASPSTTLGVGDVYQEGNMQIQVTLGSVSIGGSGVACLHSLGSGCLNVLSTTALFELTLIDGGRFKLKTAPGAWAERANTFDGVLQIYSDVNRAQTAYWSFCDPAYDGQRTTNPSPPVDCPEGDKIQFVDQTVASSFVEIVVETPSGPPLDCDGFMPPFDQALSLKAKAKRAIPIKLELYDADGYLVTDQDIVAPPVINVGFKGQVYGDAPPDSEDLLPLGAANEDNVMRYDPTTQAWVYNLGTKQFVATGDYTVTVVSGDISEYSIPTANNVCSQMFTRLD